MVCLSPLSPSTQVSKHGLVDQNWRSCARCTPCASERNRSRHCCRVVSPACIRACLANLGPAGRGGGLRASSQKWKLCAYATPALMRRPAALAARGSPSAFLRFAGSKLHRITDSSPRRRAKLPSKPPVVSPGPCPLPACGAAEALSTPMRVLCQPVWMRVLAAVEGLRADQNLGRMLRAVSNDRGVPRRWGRGPGRRCFPPRVPSV